MREGFVSDGFEKLASTIDRFQEAHLWLHTMEDYYHFADKFCWSLNVFLKALNEVPNLIGMELQNQSGFPKWFRDHRHDLKSDPLIHALSKGRDRVVHKSMLLPKSSAAVGVTEGRGMKLGFGMNINPLQDSDHAMHCYLAAGDFFDILMPDEDSLPCVEREWRLPDFDEELIDLCSPAWLRVNDTVADVLKWLGEDVPPQTLACRRTHQAVRFKTYNRATLRKWLAEMQTTPASTMEAAA
jgi:hypothetical protein